MAARETLPTPKERLRVDKGHTLPSIQLQTKSYTGLRYFICSQTGSGNNGPHDIYLDVVGGLMCVLEIMTNQTEKTRGTFKHRNAQQ